MGAYPPAMPMQLQTYLRGGKGRQWEGGIREPFYIKAPGVTKADSKSDPS